MHDRYLKTYEAARCSCIYWGPGVEGFHVKIVLQAMRANVEEWESRACAHEQVKRACSKGMFVRPWIFSRFSKVLSLGVIERGVFLSKNLFQWFDEQSKVDGEAKHHYMQVGHLGSTAEALCLKSNLSDYVYRIIPTLKVFTEKPPHFQADLEDFEHKQLTYDKKSLSNFYDFTVKKTKNLRPEFIYVAFRQRMSSTIGTFSVTF